MLQEKKGKGINIMECYGKIFYAPKKPLKKYLQCGKKYTHNNCWCSAECCKIYKELNQ